MKRIYLFVLFFIFVVLGVQAQEKAFSVQGNSKNYITVPHFSVPAALTVEAWIKVPTLTGTKTNV
ncbi:MAG: LamG domain-containing protein, partial [Bacteroidales bacterium]|nr:LamG domain-containing protein [Bacteroidales bacterium]